MLGKSTSKAEIQDITRNGVWLFAKGREYLLAFKDYPWFKDAPVSAIYNVRLMHQSHLFWPDLDVDLDVEMPDVAHDRLIFHFLHVVVCNDMAITRCGYKYISISNNIV